MTLGEGELPAWARRSPPSGSGAPPIDVPAGLAMPMLVSFGVIGGLAIGHWAVQHLFIEGTTERERRGMFAFAGISLAAWGAAKLADVDRSWWWSVEGAARAAETAVVPEDDGGEAP